MRHHLQQMNVAATCRQAHLPRVGSNVPTLSRPNLFSGD